MSETWKRKGFKSKTDYDNYLARKRGYTSFREYQEEMAKRKGYKSFSEYIYAKEKERRKTKGTPLQRERIKTEALCLLINEIIPIIPDEINKKLNLSNKLNDILECETRTRKKTKTELIKRKTVLDLLD